MHHVLVGALELAFIGLGANLGSGRTTLEQAVAALQALPGVRPGGVSRLYRTKPVGPVVQADFWNAALSLWVPSEPDPEPAAMSLLAALKGLERAFGRQPRERWGPRELDLDLILFGAHRLHVKRLPVACSDDARRAGVQWLEVPHPLAAERLFVLAPLGDLAPDLVPPGWEVSVAEARARVARREGPEAVRVVAEWDAAGQRWRDLEAGRDPAG